MVKTDVKIKEFITMEERAIITNHLVDSYFTENDDGSLTYTPYMIDSALTTIFFLYCVEGVKFGENEKVYESVCADEELVELYTTTLSTNLKKDSSSNKMIETINSIMNDVIDMVEFKKQQIIHNNPVFNNKMLEILEVQKQLEVLKLEIAQNENKMLLQQINQNNYGEKVMSYMTPEETASLNKKMLNEEMDFGKLAELVTEKYLKSDNHKKNVIEMKSTLPKSNRKKSVSGASKSKDAK
jgi:hypothetical protein